MDKSLSGNTVSIIDYESGNLKSVSRALEYVGAKVKFVSHPNEVLDSDAVVLPGVGSGKAAMHSLKQRGLVDPIRKYINSGKPFFGICLGMQLLLERTDEGNLSCLGSIPGEARKLPDDVKVPHMGWNQVVLAKEHSLFQDIPERSYFYFVHSYYPKIFSPDLVVASTDYGLSFCSVLARDKLVATQFHPEKSGPVGLMVYRNFMRLAFDGM